MSARLSRYPLIVQFLKFALVGVSNTLLTLLVYTFLLKVVGMWYLAASAIGFIAGATNGFLLNRRWTFREHVGDALTPVRWAVVQTCGLAVNEGMLYVLVTRRPPGQGAGPGGGHRDRDRHDLPRQPRLDVPRTRHRGRRRWAPR